MKRDRSACGWALVVVAAALLAGCTSVATPPDTVVDPLITGHWVSEEVVAPGWRITLDTGQVVDIDPLHMQQAIANTVDRKEGTLIMFGRVQGSTGTCC